MSINDQLRQVYMLNLRDAERWIEYAKKSNDQELLHRAQADWQIWHDKLQAFSSQI